jgi:predicted AlkP superfamily pyrophosphatase or phosphodiesterase
VNLVFVSDHGMTEIDPERVIALRRLLGGRAGQVEFTGAIAGLRPPAGTEAEVLAALRAQPHLQAYRREETPESWHYRDNRRIPPIVVAADEGWLITKNPPPPPGSEEGAHFYKATHGFDPALPSMHATFFAWGPACKSGVTIPPFENICVYPLLCSMLGLTPAKCDGDARLVREVLKE